MTSLTEGNQVASDLSLWTHVDLSYYPLCLNQYTVPNSLSSHLRSAKCLTISTRSPYYPLLLKEIFMLAYESPRLTSLCLPSAVDVTEDFLIDFFKTTKGTLKYCDLSFCRQIGSQPIHTLIEYHPKIQYLNLSHTSFTDDGLLELHRLSDLEELSLQGCFSLTRTSMSNFLQHSFPPRLSKLNLSYLFTVVGEWLAHVPSNVKFERLDIRYTEGITKKDVQELKRRWGTGCIVLENAKLENDDEIGWVRYVEEITETTVVS